MTQETCCRGNSDERPKRWTLSREAKEVIHHFSADLLSASEKIRVESRFSGNPNKHFFPYNMQRFRYFVREAEDSYVETEQPANIPTVKGTNRFSHIGAIGFFDHKLDNAYRQVEGFVKANKDQQERIIIKFLNELGFLQTDVLGGQFIEKENDHWEGYNIPHPNLPIIAEFRRQRSEHTLPHVWFSYYELKEHQLGFDLPEFEAVSAV